MERQAPVFVRIDEYKDVLNIIDLIKNKIRDAKSTLAEINDIKNQEDAELASWAAEIHDMEKKVEYMDTSLFEPEM